MLKRYGGRFGVWFGYGRQSAKTKFVSKTWLRTVFPPYLRGVGINFSVGTRSLRVGLYKAIAGYVSSEYDDENIDVGRELTALGWRQLDTTPEVIKEWHSSPEPQSDTTPSSSTSASSAEPASSPTTTWSPGPKSSP